MITKGFRVLDDIGGIETSGSVKDLAKQKGRVEGESKCTEAFRNSIECLPFSVFVVDMKLRIVYMNPAFERLTGFRKEDAASGKVFFEAHPDDQEQAESSVIMALVGRTTRCQCRLRGLNGSFHAFEVDFSPLTGNDSCLVLCVDTRSDDENSRE